MMTTLHFVEKTEEKQQPVWDAFPSWAQFSWLFLLSTLSALRGALFFRFGVGGWEMWVIGSGALIVCAAILRHWAHYELTREQLTVRNGYTGREIQSILLNDVRDVTVQQGVVADFFGIGTLVVHSRTTDRLLSIRGVSDPEDVKIRIEVLARRSHGSATSTHPPLS
ncbi:PH domain-containing protein [Petrachloros mirabilis]